MARTTGRTAAGTRTWPASFADRLTAPLPGWREVVRAGREGAFRSDVADAARIPVRHDGLPCVGARQTAVTWVGHATYVIQIGGLVVLTDPVWSSRIPGVRARLTPPGVAWTELPRVDAVVISHNHYDHLDARTVGRLPRETPVFIPGGLGRWFRRRGFRRVTELDWWESAVYRGVRFDLTPAHHWSRRTLTDTCRALWGGWILTEESGTRVYFAGDTAYGHWFGEIGARYPGIDVALLPVGAYAPRWFMAGTHMDPGEAVRAHRDLRATRMATMHWGTFVLSAEPVLEPLELTRAAWEAAGGAREDLWDLAIGESRVL